MALNRRGHSLVAGAAAITLGLTTFVSAQEVSGTSTIGPRTSHIFTLRIPPDPSVPGDIGDTLPPGGEIFYQFGIFDTGSNTIGINNVSLTASDGTVYQSTANLLNLCGPGDADCGTPIGSPPRVPGLPILDMRIWGLSVVDFSTGGAPLDTPEAEVDNLLVRPAAIAANLIGGPVTNNVIAYIDYTNQISHSFVLLPGADTTFYEPSAAGIPAPLYELQLQRFGPTTPAIDGATRGSLYSLVDFAFVNNGSVVATGDVLPLPDTSSREAKVFFDTGNTTTQITLPMATALGIDPSGTPDATVNIGLAGGGVLTLPCFTISNAEFTGIGGHYKYAIASPLVCISDAPAFALPQSNPHDVILGTNFFEQTQILWNGPGDKIGMFQGVALNGPPIADAGEDQTVECTSSLGTSVTLDGTGSYDPDGDTLSYLWTGVFGTEIGPTPNVTVPLGANSVTLSVDDGNGATDTDSVEVTVVDTTAPTVDAGPNVTLEATSPDGAPFDVSTQVTASDTCGPVGLFESPVPASYPLGSTVVTVTATDGSGNSASDAMTVTVVDTIPPDLEVTVTPTILWPPNHNMVPIDWTYVVSDIADPSPLVELVHVQSDEGDGVNTFDPAFDVTEVVGRKGSDIQLVDGQLFLRAERAGNSDGRVYTLTFQATDASGNSTTATKTVVVPHNQ